MHCKMPHTICSTNEYRVALSPEVQKGMEVTAPRKACTLRAVVSSSEKYNREIKLTDKVN